MGYRIARRTLPVPAVAPPRAALHATRFASPQAVPTPPGAEGWQDLYAYSLPFSEDRQAEEDAAFWFRETIHWPRPVRPLEACFLQEAVTALSQFNHRHYLVPTAKGVDFRLLHGYCYLSPGSIDDEALVEERGVAFTERAGFYYEHWDELYVEWKSRIRDLLERMEALTFPDLPDAVSVAEVRAARGLGRGYDLPAAYRELLDLGAQLWQYHFEFLNLGYAAYLDYFAFCRSLFPDITDLHVAEMVAGIDVDLFRPDQELRRLARLAIELGVDDVLCHSPLDEALAAVATTDTGRAWLAEWDAAKNPWFNYSTGSGFYFDDAVWADRLEIPLGFVRNYVEQLHLGHEIDAPAQAVADERDRLAAQLRASLRGADVAHFDQKLQLARTVVHFVENHNFYVEHWGMSLLWRKLRKLSALFVQAGFWPSIDDIFFVRADELDVALRDLLASWATGTAARGPRRWPAEIERRKAILHACAASSPPPALGSPPQAVTEPFTIMLWGITSESLKGWLEGESAGGDLHGFGASPGVVVGRARVVESADDLDLIEDGEILVADLTCPSWAPVFARIAGTVTEAGGMMCHVAIVCREYGLPAITGVSGATQKIRSGQLLRLDGGTGTVTVLS